MAAALRELAHVVYASVYDLRRTCDANTQISKCNEALLKRMQGMDVVGRLALLATTFSREHVQVMVGTAAERRALVEVLTHLAHGYLEALLLNRCVLGADALPQRSRKAVKVAQLMAVHYMMHDTGQLLKALQFQYAAQVQAPRKRQRQRKHQSTAHRVRGVSSEVVQTGLEQQRAERHVDIQSSPLWGIAMRHAAVAHPLRSASLGTTRTDEYRAAMATAPLFLHSVITRALRTDYSYMEGGEKKRSRYVCLDRAEVVVAEPRQSEQAARAELVMRAPLGRRRRRTTLRRLHAAVDARVCVLSWSGDAESAGAVVDAHTARQQVAICDLTPCLPWTAPNVALFLDPPVRTEVLRARMRALRERA